MNKVIIYIAMSLDGYIADKNGSVSWLGGDGSDRENYGSYPEFIETVDTVVLGYNTYHQIVTELSPETWPYNGKETYVLTHRDCADRPGIRFINATVVDLLSKLKEEQRKSIWICGGAVVVNQVLQTRMADEITVSVIPILLGDGIRLFDEKGLSQKLKLVSCRNYNGIVDLTYQMRTE
jgi:dihydrofolate reductase